MKRANQKMLENFSSIVMKIILLLSVICRKFLYLLKPKKKKVTFLLNKNKVQDLLQLLTTHFSVLLDNRILISSTEITQEQQKILEQWKKMKIWWLKITACYKQNQKAQNNSLHIHQDTMTHLIIFISRKKIRKTLNKILCWQKITLLETLHQ